MYIAKRKPRSLGAAASKLTWRGTDGRALKMGNDGLYERHDVSKMTNDEDFDCRFDDRKDSREFIDMASAQEFAPGRFNLEALREVQVAFPNQAAEANFEGLDDIAAAKGLHALRGASLLAEEASIPDMSLEEINVKIAASRAEEGE